jgi:cytochrome P450
MIRSTATESEPKYDLVSPQFFADPHAVFRRMRAEDPVYWHPGLKAWALVRYDDVQRMFRDPRFSAEAVDYYRGDLPPSFEAKLQAVNRFRYNMILFKDAPTHTRFRSLITKGFSSKYVESLRPFVQTVVDEQIDMICHQGKMDVIKQLALPLPVRVISKILGIPEADFPRFKTWTDDFFALVGTPRSTPELVDRGYHGMIGLDGYVREALEDRRKRPGDDLLSLLLHAEEQSQVLSTDEIVATAVLFVLAGYETTAHLIGNGLLALLEHPDQLDKLRADPQLVAGAVEEILRYNSAAFQMLRRAREPIELDGHLIQGDEIVLGFLHAANRDPAQFTDADLFDITRKDNYHVGFGYGPHICIGAPVARMETQIAINTMLRRLPEIALASTSLEWVCNTIIRGLRALPVTFRS